MAFEVPHDVEVPEVTLTEGYEIRRMGKFPSCRVSFAEAVTVFEDPVVVTMAADMDADGRFEQLTIPSWAGRTDLVGRLVELADGTLLGTVESWDDLTTTAVVNMPPDVDITNMQIRTPFINPTGSVSHRRSKGGRRWDLFLYSNNPEAMQRMAEMLVTAYVEAVVDVLTILGDTTYSLEDVRNAVLFLASNGVTLDTFLSKQAEQLEVDRRSGAFTAAVVLGDAPEPVTG